MSHQHHHENSGSRLLLATLLNFLITIVEIIGGVFSNSLALLSDAFHNMGDTIAVFLAYLANRISRKKPSFRNTFGAKRIEILAALFNASAMIIICIFLAVESVKRFLHPEPIAGKMMMIIAFIGLIANLIAALLLHSQSRHNINFRAAYLHLLGDTLSSVAVIIGGILIYYFQVFWIDPLITFLISLYIAKETYSVFRQSYKILMQATPSGINIEELKNVLYGEFSDIENLHHVHVWNLNDSDIYLECHIDLKNDMKISETDVLAGKLRSFLHDRYDIHHLTVQFEFGCCDNKSVLH